MEYEMRSEIRPMEERDICRIGEMEQLIFSEPWSKEQIQSGLGSRLDTWFVCEGDGEILGYAALRVLLDEGEIQRIAVLPGYRRRGIARKLMDEMVSFSRMRGVAAVSLEVRESNESARNLYASYGFLEEAVRRGYYHKPEEDAIIMWNRTI